MDLTLDGVASMCGVDPRTVHNWRRDGLPGTKDSKNRWHFESAAVVEWIRKREREQALGEVAQIDEHEARRRKLAAEAALTEHELAVKQGAAVSIADWEASMAAMIGAARARAIGLGAKLGPLVSAVDSEAECKALIDGGVAEFLTELMDFDGSVQNFPECEPEPSGSGEAVVAPVGATSSADGKRVGRRPAKAAR